MQLMIDTLQDSPARLRMAAASILSLAAAIDAEAAGDKSFAVGPPLAQPPAPPAPPESDPVRVFRQNDKPVAAPGAVPPPPPPSFQTSIAPPAPPSAVPPPPPPAAAAPAAEVDARGMPYDQRIHSSAKSKTAEGNWRNARGVDKVEREQIEAQLLGRPWPPVGTHPGGTVQQSAPLVPPPPSTATPAADVTAFKELMLKITPLMQAGKLKKEQVNEACAAVSGGTVKSLPELAKAPAIVAAVSAYLDSLI